jgi:DNA-binding MarR family transcriptional regulator
MILWHASSHPLGSAQIELAKELAVSPGQLSLLLEQLRERGLLDCVRDPHDRRRQRNVLTATGRAAWSEIYEKLSQKLAGSNEVPLIDVVDRLRTLLDELCQPASSTPELKLHRPTVSSESTSPEGN